MNDSVLSRRALFSVGGLALLSACSSAGSSTPSAAGSGAGPHGSHAPQRPGEGAVRRWTMGNPQYRVSKGPDAIVLTIDDGPDPEWTPQILELLAEYEITATFCQVGARVSAHPDLVRAVANEGHLIANHTWTHEDLAKASPSDVRDQIERTNDEIERVSGHRPSIFRAPFGTWSDDVFTVCQQLGLHPLDWSVDPRDWSKPGADHIVRTILRNTRSGSIILEHDGGGDRSQTLAALRVVVPRLRDTGYRFVTP